MLSGSCAFWHKCVLIGAGVVVGSVATLLIHRYRRGNSALEVARSHREGLPSTVILVRHGESEGNADHTLYRTRPDNLVRLTQRGIVQADRAGERIKAILGHQHVHMVVSPFQRTFETARRIRCALKGQIVHTYIESRIREQEFGNLQGEDFQQLRTQQSRVGRLWYRFPTGESGADVYDRVKSWWCESLLMMNLRIGYEPANAVVVVTHGLTMRFVLMQLYGWSPATFHSVWNADNCDLYVLKKDLTLPGPSPYALCPELGDMPRSSIDILVTLHSTGSHHLLTLEDYLSIPPPRTTQLALVKQRLGLIYAGLAEQDIAAINFHPSEEEAGAAVQGYSPRTTQSI